MKLDKYTQNIVLQSGKYNKERDYWLNKLKGEVIMGEFPADFKRSGEKKYENQKCIISGDTFQKLKEITSLSDLAMYMMVLSGINYLISSFSGTNDVTVGMPIFLNTAEETVINDVLLIRTKVDENLSFKEYLSIVNETIVEADSYRNYPFDKLAQTLDLHAEDEKTPLIKTIVMSAKLHDKECINELKPDCVFDIETTGDEVVVDIMYNCDLFKQDTFLRIGGYLKNYLSTVTNNPNIKLQDIDILSDSEKEKILFEFNNTKRVYPREKPVHLLFEEQAMITPDKIALVHNGYEMTYRELDLKTNMLARTLRQKGICEDQTVGIMAERSIEMVVGILAILKAGGAYLPIDVKYPIDRVKYMLKDSNTNILLVQSDLRDDLDGICENVLLLEDKTIYSNDNSSIGNINNSSNMAYVIYTSGSTGKPKGVIVEHKSIVRLVKNNEFITLVPDDKILQTGAVVFDASTFEIWGALLNGLTLYLVSDEVILDADKLEHTINENGITTIWLTSPLFNQLSEQNENLFLNIRNLIVGGDALSPKHINKVRKNSPKTKIINGYGPTENTTFSVCFTIDKDYTDSIPIGKPISNSTAYIFNHQNKLQPIGIPGELFVGGDGVARGYLNQPELTKERFISNPFNSEDILYKTGDMAKWLPDGTIEYLGRRDSQVKIRGFRIELGEIEQCISKYPNIMQAIVIAKEDKTLTKNLFGYFTANPKIDISELRAYLRERLPDYMVPSYLILLDKMPLTVNGKVDKRQLPEPNNDLDELSYEEPDNEIEKNLIEIFSNILGVTRVGKDDNFFDIGGHSLSATILVNAIRKEFGVDISLKQFFSMPTVKDIANLINQSAKSKYTRIEAAPIMEHYPTSSAQKRLYIHSQLEPECISYNMPIIMIGEGEIDCIKCEATLKKLVDRHEAFRTTFELIDGQPVQKIHNYLDFKMEYQEIDEKYMDDKIKAFIRPFDLSSMLLFRAALVKLCNGKEKSDTNKYILMLDMHHIIADGMSVAIIIKEFANLYNNISLSDIKLQYKDYAVWQQKMANSDMIKKQEKFWLNTFEGDIPSLKLPLDNARTSVRSFDGDTLCREITPDLTEKLRNIAANENVTLFMLLLASYYILLSKYSEQEDIIVACGVGGRTHPDVGDMVGMFINMVPLRNYPQCDKVFTDFLKELKTRTLEAFDNQDYQFDDIVDKLNIKRERGRNPIFDAVFQIQNVDIPAVEIDNIKFSFYEPEYRFTKYDLVMVAEEKAENLIFNFQYSTKLFNSDTIDKLMSDYIKILEVVCTDNQIKIKDIILQKKYVKLENDDFNNFSFNF